MYRFLFMFVDLKTLCFISLETACHSYQNMFELIYVTVCTRINLCLLLFVADYFLVTIYYHS